MTTPYSRGFRDGLEAAAGVARKFLSECEKWKKVNGIDNRPTMKPMNDYNQGAMEVSEELRDAILAIPVPEGPTTTGTTPSEREGFEEWHRRECPDEHECKIYPDIAWTGGWGARWEGRTCREVYEKERGA